ncbi:MAG: hydroxysqualene dehydroxylase, partial [Acidimicrobiia bacterium]
HQVPDLGLSEKEIEFFSERMWQLMTSCYDRRDEDYERLSWWDYLDANHFTNPAYRSLLVAGLTRTLVAAQATSASTKTGGNTLLQLIFTMMSPGKANDRVLDGPTNDRWLNPWLDYLRELGVEYHKGHNVTAITMKDGRIEDIWVEDEDHQTRNVKADHFVLATPVERAADLITDDMIKADATLGLIEKLSKSVSWMNGLQFYLNEDVTINKGHIIFSDSEWALTGISQIQFWKDYELADRFNGKVKGILSVDISDWLHTKYKGELAEDLHADKVKEYVWEQIKEALNVEGEIVLSDDMVEHWYLDRDIQWVEGERKDEDKEPLLVNTVDSWGLRPEAVTRIPNLFLASDYVRTNTDLATMEGANEAARRAVNGIIQATGSNDALCRIWPLEEPMFFAPFRWLDKRRFRVGQAWSAELPWWMKVFLVPWGLAFSAMFAVRSLLSFLRR